MLEYVLGLENTDKKIREAVGRTLRTKISMFVHLTTMPMKKSPGCSHKQGGGDDQERQGGGHQRHQAGY